MKRPRVGHIEFLNCLPIYWGLARTGALVDVELHKDTPDRLNEKLVSGELDVGPISVVEYLRHRDRLRLIPDIAVAADGAVLSVNLVTKRPLAELPSQPDIALAATSRTGVALARLLLEQRYDRRPRYRHASPVLHEAMDDVDGAVLIGDEALRVHHSPGTLHVTDLAAAWKEWTGQAMVFAVWAARDDYAQDNPDTVAGLHKAFRESIAICESEMETVVASAARWEPFAPEALAEYFEHLQFNLSDDHVKGLVEFSRRAEEYTGVRPLEHPRFIEPTPGMP
ncbi:menaquinone biosynthetic enzyme MqnA/MqnD family protein [Haloglycomyces albus]|uniref:menaquinone biosynthetic enzyme MqnA/MqnD family protein n=1 Tax=Haloglycomyces albus TaxID=526067 RepID=UPI00054E776E|nr:menaquinone biosynthesis protein [Haloglycomyces albus]